MHTSYSLSRLIAPVTPEEFFRDYWEQKPLLITREQREYFAGLLTLAELDRVITTLSLHSPEISMTNAARQLRVEDFTYPSGLIDVARLYQQFADGSTIVFSQLESRVAALADLCRSMECEMSTRFQTNVYATPASAQGFKPHYDSHDVFVLQVHGSKHWLIYDTPVELPYRGQQFNPREVAPGEVSMEFTLHAGDLVYIPRGVMHDARTTQEDSVHVTLGVLFTSWTDLLVEALARVGMRDPTFRRSLPVGFARPDFDRAAARETFRQLWKRIGESADFDAALDHFADDFVSTREPLLWGQMTQIERLKSLSGDTEVGVRPNLLYQLRETEQGVVVSAYGADTSLPRQAAEPLRFALTHARFRVRELPGALDEPGKLVLVRKLVREGLLQIL